MSADEPSPPEQSWSDRLSKILNMNTVYAILAVSGLVFFVCNNLRFDRGASTILSIVGVVSMCVFWVGILLSIVVLVLGFIKVPDDGSSRFTLMKALQAVIGAIMAVFCVWFVPTYIGSSGAVWKGSKRYWNPFNDHPGTRTLSQMLKTSFDDASADISGLQWPAATKTGMIMKIAMTLPVIFINFLLGSGPLNPFLIPAALGDRSLKSSDSNNPLNSSSLPYTILGWIIKPFIVIQTFLTRGMFGMATDPVDWDIIRTLSAADAKVGNVIGATRSPGHWYSLQPFWVFIMGVVGLVQFIFVPQITQEATTTPVVGAAWNVFSMLGVCLVVMQYVTKSSCPDKVSRSLLGMPCTNVLDPGLEGMMANLTDYAADMTSKMAVKQ